MRIPRIDSLILTATFACLALPSAHAQVCPGDDAFEDNDDCASTAVLTAGTHGSLVVKGAANVGGIDDDYFQISVPNGLQLTVDALFTHANGDIDLLLYQGLNCAALTSLGQSVTDNETVVATNNSGGTLDYSLKVDAYGTGFDCNNYTLVVTISGDPCAVFTPDSYEDNDDCLSAQVLAGAGATGLNTQNGDEDYYIITTQPGNLTFVDISFAHALGDLDLEIFDDLSCVNQVDISQSTTDDESVSFLNTSGSPISIVVHVYGYGPGFGCNDYDIAITSTFDPCSTLAEDNNEENDDCVIATVATEGTITGQAAFIGDPDWFRVDLSDGETMTADLLFVTANGDLDMVLYDGCPGTEIDVSESVTDNEQLIYTNTSGGPLSVYIEAYVWVGSVYGCNGYDFSLTLSGGVAGTPMCVGDGTAGACPCANESTLGAGEGCRSSIGFGAKLATSGSNSVSADDLGFTVTQARPNQTGMLLQGASQISATFKDGHFCMGNPTERIEFAATDGSGTASTSGSIVTNGNVVSGNTHYYQWWFRDPGGVSPCGTGSNFSAGIAVTFAP